MVQTFLPYPDFDRTAAWGHRLAVPAGTSVRFEPGIPQDVDLVPLGGNRIVPGLRGECGGQLDDREAASKDRRAPDSAAPEDQAAAEDGRR